MTRYVRSSRRVKRDSILNIVYGMLPSKRANALPSRVIANKLRRHISGICSALKQLEAQEFITKCIGYDTGKYDDGDSKRGYKPVAKRKTFWYISKRNIEMSLNLEGLRKECGRGIYESIRSQKGMQGMVPWHQIDAEHKRGFEKMAGIVFDCLFRKHPDDLVTFFTDGRAD